MPDLLPPRPASKVYGKVSPPGSPETPVDFFDVVNAQLYGSTYAHPHATVEKSYRYGFTFTAAVASPVVS